MTSSPVVTHQDVLPESEVIWVRPLLAQFPRHRIRAALNHALALNMLRRVFPGAYVRVRESRFGPVTISPDQFVEQYAALSGETIVRQGATMANAFELSTQVPMRPIFWTSGRTRTLEWGKLRGELQHVSLWMLAAPNQPAGDALRALLCMHPENAVRHAQTIQRVLIAQNLGEHIDHMKALAHHFPEWLAHAVLKMESPSTAKVSQQPAAG